jgi:hypothetical protein
MKKFYYQVINPTTKEVINQCYEPGEDQDSVSVSFKLLEKGVQIVRVQAKEWNKIETLEDAMYKLGLDDPLVEVYRNNKYLQQDSEKDVLAYLKLRIITAAINDGWEPKFTKDELRWYPWFYFYTAEDLKKLSDEDRKRVVGRAGSVAGSNGGLVCSYALYASSCSNAFGGVRLAFESEEKADYAGRKFIDIYADYLLP